MKEKSQSGRTIVEMMMVLFVLGTFTASTMALVSKGMDKYRASLILSQVREVRKAVSSRYAALGVYTGLTSEVMIKERLLSANMVTENKLYHAFKSEIGLSVADSGGTGRSFKITFPGIPLPNCLDLALIDWATDSTAALVSIKINDKEYKWEVNKVGADGKLVAPSDTALPVTLPKAASVCREGSNTLTWEFN